MIKLINRQVVTRFRLYSVSSAGAKISDVNPNFSEWAKKLKEAGVGDIDFNLKCIVAHVLNKKFHTLSSYENIKFTEEQLKEFQRLCECRVARMPLQYILGEWDFMDLTLKMKPTVFIPRPETEEFVNLVIKKNQNQEKFNILEVGCGCGAMSLAILNNIKFATSVAIDRSNIATNLANENAKILQLNDRFSAYHHTMSKEAYMPEIFKLSKFDAIISNPPYVKSKEFQHLQPEVVVYENFNALNGGEDGLNVARDVCDLACEHLKPGGKLWMELGSSHPPLIKTIISLKYDGKLKYVSGYEDQYEQERFVEIEKL